MAGNYEEILMPLLAGLKAVPRDPKQEREIRKLNYQIEELRKQSYNVAAGSWWTAILALLFL